MVRDLLRNLIVVLALAPALPALAQQITFTASVDRNVFSVGEQIKLSIKLTNGQGAFTNPNMGGLIAVGGPFEGSEFNYINGRLSSAINRSFILTATQPGEYTIGPAETRVGNNIIRTDPITVRVEKGATAGSDRLLDRAQQDNRDLFVTLTLNKHKAWVGEQVIATWTLYSRHANMEVTNHQLPQLTGFWSEEIDLGRNAWDEGVKLVNGIQYRTATLRKQLLFPQRSGTLQIGPAVLSCVVNRHTFNPFGSGVRVDVKSNPVDLEVKELPAGKPAPFSGAVGELDLSVDLDRNTVPANEALTLKVKLSGRANLKLLETIRPELPIDMEVYDPRVNDRITTNVSGMSGSREFEYLVIPRHEGLYLLPPITFSYFDTRSSTYRTLRSDTLRIHVDKGDGAAVASRSPVTTRADVQVLGNDIRYIRTGDLGLRPRGRYLFGSWRYLAGLGAPALGFLFLLGWRARRDRQLADAPGMRRRQADRAARQRLQLAAKALKQGQSEAFHTALAKALEGYFTDKFDLGVAEVTDDLVREKLGRIDDGGLADRFLRLKAEAEMARFAPVSNTPQQQHYDEAAAVIKTIETNWRP